MADIIHLLPDSVANQIAAGEVIQRPASVVKELIENAIDAKAKHIQVRIVEAGKSGIQIIDDGIGMTETDARLAFERHATSKIQEATDLYSLSTMGFRGEALPSIASVAQVELKTRTENDEIGTCISISGSKIVDQVPAVCSVGSNFSVNNLFYNVPARRKFLKSNQTELSNIVTEYERTALARPDLAFSLYHNDVELSKLLPGSLRQRIVEVFGKKINQQLLPIEVDTTIVKINGFVATPESSRKKGMHQYFYANGRYMRHPYFHRAIMSAYEHLIPIGEQVSYFIKFEVAPAHIDVNIHPTKTEIKFEDEQAIWQILLAATKEALGKFSMAPTIDFDTEECPEIPLFNTENRNPLPPKVEIDQEYNPFKSFGSSASKSKPASSNWEKLYVKNDQPLQPQAGIYQDSTPNNALPLYPSDNSTEILSDTKQMDFFQYRGQYILTSVRSGLLIIDQQRAHTRILFERFMKQLSSHKGISQRVLFPEILEVPLSKRPILQSILDVLTDVGFDLSDMGNGSYAINGTPAEADGLRPKDLLLSLLDNVTEKESNIKSDLNERISLVLARKSSIVVGQILSKDEMSDLIEKLFACKTPSYTPDGKKILYLLQHKIISEMLP